MKIAVFFGVIVFGIIATSCTSVREKTAEELLESPKMEKEIYSAILSDSARLVRLIAVMMTDDNSKIRMTENSSLVKTVCLSARMDSLMSKDSQLMESMSNRFIKKMMIDSVLCDNTCTRMMENNYLKNYFKKHVFMQIDQKPNK